MSPGEPLDETVPDEQFQAFYRRSWLPMVRLASLLVDDAASAEDVVQDAFIAFHRNRGKLRSDEADVAYLRTAVVNGARSVLRRRAVFRKHAPALREQPEYYESADSAILAAPENSEVMAGIRRLPRRQREVLVLRYWQDLTHAEVAASLGVSESTAKSTTSRALAALEHLLEEQK